ncbi:hypothetical protein GCK32_013912 [Trichostrongylus colubriformis]|uniref:Uncharacterized protein n=1 Tax=Trichostrongylus colubriformis TaxID=6319 RepID=A0AAN8F5V1_TRICO
MRLDRIMCLEDIITVFRQVNDRSTVDVEEDEQYEQLRDLELSDTILFARAAAEYFARVMKMCTNPTPVSAVQRNQQVDTSASSSSTEATTIQARGDSCWTLGPPLCSELASNPFNKPANTQPPEPELSHVARWLDTIRLDDIEEYHEPFPEPYDHSDEAAETYTTDVVCDN